LVAVREVAKAKERKPCALLKTSKHRTMAKAFDTRELVAAPAAAKDGANFPVTDPEWLNKKKTINDLPKELLVSVFEAVEDQNWVRRTVGERENAGRE